MTGETFDDIFWYMPLRLLYSCEHYYYVREGVQVRPKGWRNTLDDLIKNV